MSDRVVAGSFPVQSFGLLTRRPDLTLGQFIAHWRDVHGPLGLRTLPLVRQYVQNYRSPMQLPGIRTAACDGVAETWFSTLADALSLPSSDAYRQGLYLDEPNFMSGDTTFLITLEDPVIAAPRPTRNQELAKALIFLARRHGVSTDDFRHGWREIHGDRLRTAAAAPLAYTRCMVTDELYSLGEPAYDGVAEIWWPSARACEEAWVEHGWVHRFTRDLEQLVDPERASCLVVNEGRLLWA